MFVVYTGMPRPKLGKLFFVTVSVSEVYDGIKRDFLDVFVDVSTYCVAVESSASSDKVDHHIHAYLEFSEKYSWEVICDYLRDVFVDSHIDVQQCRSRRNTLKYITKEDKEPLFNCKVSELHFNYRCYRWAVDNKYFSLSHYFVVEHKHVYRFLERYHAEVRSQLISGCLRRRVLCPLVDWCIKAQQWLNVFQLTSGFKRKQLFLFGPSNVGKSTFVMRMFDMCTDAIYYPDVGKFAFQDLRLSVHKVILFEEFNVQYHCLSMLKRLLEGRPFRASVKGGVGNVVKWDGPVVFVSNYPPPDEEAFKNRLLVVEATGETPYWEAALGPLPKIEEETISEEGASIVEVSSGSEQEEFSATPMASDASSWLS